MRSSERLKRLSETRGKGCTKAVPSINKNTQAEENRPNHCPKCGSARFDRNGRLSHVTYDLRFSPTGIRRWVVRHSFFRYQCRNCKHGQNEVPREGRFGVGLRAYIIYQVIELRVSQRAVSRTLETMFGLRVPIQTINNIKVSASAKYEETHKAILRHIVSGALVHVDETKIKIRGEARWVWVFTNLESVAYVYSDLRQAGTAHDLLGGFGGVLVSDFYSVYDSLECEQQKCLVHLLRDMNQDVLREPFNDEMKKLASSFGLLLRPMVETVDRFGLEARYLRMHLRAVARFYRDLSTSNYQTEAAVGYKRRFEKNRHKLFLPSLNTTGCHGTIITLNMRSKHLLA